MSQRTRRNDEHSVRAQKGAEEAAGRDDGFLSG